MLGRAGDFSDFTGWGLARHELFGHLVVPVPKPYPDLQLLLEARGMPRRLLETGRFQQINLYTTDFYDLPEELFWHPGNKLASSAIWGEGTDRGCGLVDTELRGDDHANSVRSVPAIISSR